ncbi:MAG: dephospho-CoA kinase [Acidobacteriota bacterium]
MNGGGGAEGQRFLVGLTGGMASGKSTVAGWLADAGFTVVDADRLVADLYAPGGKGAVALAELFGSSVLAETGAVDKSKVAEIIFANPQARRRVEKAIHPLVNERFREIAMSTEGVVVYEATLLVESGHSDNFDLVVTVEAPREQRLGWAIDRGMGRQEAQARLAAQGTGERRRAGADRIVMNDGSLDDLKREIDALIDELNGDA